MMETIEDLSTLWSATDYPAFGDRWGEVSRDLVEGLDVRGKRVLDVGTGPGATAIEAAARGGEVTGIDYSMPLLAVAQERADEAGVQVDWLHGDMQAMPLPHESFDLVLSTFGTVYVLDPYAAASEIMRVCRPGGSIASVSFTPECGLGRIREALKQYMFQEQARELTLRMVPAIGQRPNDVFDWGVPSRVEEFFGGHPVEWEHRYGTVTLRWPSLETAAYELGSKTPPMVIAHRVLTELGWWKDAQEATREKLLELGRNGPDGYEMDVTYLVAVGERH